MKIALPEWMPDAGLLALRLTIPPMMLLGHGIPKLERLPGILESFPDPLGVGSATSAILALGGEVVAAALLVLGLGTRFAAAPFLITMLVAAFVVHADDPWERKELALLYAAPALTLLLAGGGRFSLDRLITRRASARRPGEASTERSP